MLGQAQQHARDHLASVDDAAGGTAALLVLLFGATAVRCLLLVEFWVWRRHQSIHLVTFVPLGDLRDGAQKEEPGWRSHGSEPFRSGARERMKGTPCGRVLTLYKSVTNRLDIDIDIPSGTMLGALPTLCTNVRLSPIGSSKTHTTLSCEEDVIGASFSTSQLHVSTRACPSFGQSRCTTCRTCTCDDMPGKQRSSAGSSSRASMSCTAPSTLSLSASIFSQRSAVCAFRMRGVGWQS